MNRSKSPWVFLACTVLLALSAESAFAERSLSRSKLERELKHLRESLHEAHRELAIKADKIEELSKELERISRETAKIDKEMRGAESKAKKSTQGKDEVEKPALKKTSGEKMSKNAEDTCQEVKKKPQESSSPARATSITIFYDENSAVNFQGRDAVLRFVREELKVAPETVFSVRAFANDSEFTQTNREIARNRAKFLVDYLAIRGVSGEVFREVVGRVSKESGEGGRKVVVEYFPKG